MFRKKNNPQNTPDVAEEEPAATSENTGRKKYKLKVKVIGGKMDSSELKAEEETKVAYPYFDPNLAPLC